MRTNILQVEASFHEYQFQAIAGALRGSHPLLWQQRVSKRLGLESTMRPRGCRVPIKTGSELNLLFSEIETGTGKHSTSQFLRNKHRESRIPDLIPRVANSDRHTVLGN